jgi:hypothetical protein
VPVIAPFELSLGFRDVMIGYVVLGLNQWLGEFLGVVLYCIVLFSSRIGKDAFLFQIYRLMVNEIMNICCQMLDRKGLEWNGPVRLYRLVRLGLCWILL